MGRPSTERITRDIARELCIRTGSKAIVLGSISNLGGQYVIGLNTVGCSSGDTLATEQEQASVKQDVLKALSAAASSLRGKLGESLATIQKFDVPVEATTRRWLTCLHHHQELRCEETTLWVLKSSRCHVGENRSLLRPL
jgi:eukaryotic-like serine/threonine-protein kinase